MNIRGFQSEDIPEVKRIFDKFYSKDVDFPDLMSNFLCSYTILDNNGQIISAGGVRTIAEVCLITDKDRYPRERVKALAEILHASKHIARQWNFDWLHAITDDPNWASQMKRAGFLSRGEALEIQVGGT